MRGFGKEDFHYYFFFHVFLLLSSNDSVEFFFFLESIPGLVSSHELDRFLLSDRGLLLGPGLASVIVPRDGVKTLGLIIYG